MPFPHLTDDGNSVTLDLHGATVAEARQLAIRLIARASAYGRSSIRLIHGSSTSSTGARHNTIKSMLYDLLEEITVKRQVTSTFFAEGFMILSLNITVRPTSESLRLSDLT